jgi:hypothetical protein
LGCELKFAGFAAGLNRLRLGLRERMAVLANVNDDVALGRIYPPAFVVEPGAGADGVDDLVGGGHDVCSVLDDEHERMEDVAAVCVPPSPI